MTGGYREIKPDPKAKSGRACTKTSPRHTACTACGALNPLVVLSMPIWYTPLSNPDEEKTLMNIHLEVAGFHSIKVPSLRLLLALCGRLWLTFRI